MAEGFQVQDGIDGEVTVSFHGNVALVTMNRGENRFNPSFLDDMHDALDKVESNPDVQLLITTGKGKFFSNGLDLNYLTYKGKMPDAKDFQEEHLMRMFRLLIRIVEFPVVTVAALNGHTYAAGAFLALAHDYRVMNNEKGWFCLNEVHIDLNFRPFLQELMRHRFLSGRIYLEAVVLGRRYSAQEAKEDKIVEEISPQSNLLETAINCGKSIIPKNGFQRKSLQDMKKNVIGRKMRALQNDPGLPTVRYSSNL